METFAFPTTAAELGACFGASVVGDGGTPVERLSPLQSAGKGSLSFFSNRKYAEFLDHVEGAVLFTTPEFVRPELPLTYLVVANPQDAFARVARSFLAASLWTGIDPQASVSPDAQLSQDVHVGAFARIENGAKIGRGTRIHPFAYVGQGAEIGEDCELHPRVTLGHGVRIGRRVKIFSGSVLGSDGFGFFESASGEGYTEMPQLGTVVVEDDVRIGANCTIDRGTLGETRIGKGCKLDNLVHIGHNCQIGNYSILCAQVGLGGSTVLEEKVILGGQVGLGHGVRIGQGARLGGQCGSSVNLPGGETYFLTPALPVKEVMRIQRYFRRLPELWKRIKQLETLGGQT